MDSEMLVKNQVQTSIILSPAIGVNEAFQIHLATDDGLKNSLARIRNNFGIVSALASKDRKRLFYGQPLVLSCIESDAVQNRICPLPNFRSKGILVQGLRKTLPNVKENRIDGSNGKPCKDKGFRSRQIHCEASHKMAKLRLGNF